jgi:hypothetical protein
MRIRPLGVLVVLSLLVTSGCTSGGGGTAATSKAPPASPQPATTSTTAPKPPVAIPTCDPISVPPFDAANFTSPTKINNQWLPLVPGTRIVLEGRANRGGGVQPHRVTFIVTDLVKVINGVPTVVNWDVDTNEGQLAEAELAFFAQDRDGNVWSFGEYPEEYRNGKFTGAPRTWFAGVSKAEAGVQVPAESQIGKAEVLQASAPEVGFLDCAKDVKTEDKTCVPLGCYEKVRVADERSPLDPTSGVQRKLYAPGIGNVQVEAVGDPEGETLVLVERTTLSPQELVTARQEAMKLDKHGRQVHPAYRDTQPLQAS